MREVGPGVWQWESPHPDWSGPENEALRRRLAATPAAPSEAARGVVSSYAVDEDERVLLFDPLAVPREVEELASAREAVVVLTCPWHERDTRSLVERLGVPVFTPAPDEGTPDLAWLMGADRSDAHLYSAGDHLAVGVEALPGRLPNDVVLWIASCRAVIAGDTLVDFGNGLEIPVEWLPEGVTREQVAEGLRPLLQLPVDVVLATHGGPKDRTALERALI
ncbi:MAG TPA: MBL fold metallo-hydrolase [Acidimicrobiales bacterium]|nr:MBL fold metallo-hydrolase [Acidimicrobiales bacterium]